MVAAEPVCILYDPLLADIHQDGLTAHGADVVREVLGWHARSAVVLREKKKSCLRHKEGTGEEEPTGSVFVDLPPQWKP